MTLNRNWFHILLSLADKDRHGSDVMRDVLQQTNGSVTLWPATLYGAFDAMAAAGLIAELTDHPVGASERRRYYRITPEGRTTLAAEAERLEALASTVRNRLAARRQPAG